MEPNGLWLPVTVAALLLETRKAGYDGDTIGPCTGGVLRALATRSSALGATATGLLAAVHGNRAPGGVLVGALALGKGVALHRSSRT